MRRSWGSARRPKSSRASRLRERIGARGHTYEAQLADGRWLQVNERRTGDGGYVSVGTDITTLKRHEEKLLDSERRLMASVADLRRSRQLLELQARELAVLAERYLEEKANAEFASRAKSEFLANMSHELRTPLNAILGFSEIMQSQVFGALGSERYVEYCDYIRGSGERLLAVITDVLDMSRLDAGQMPIERASFPLADMMTDSLRSILCRRQRETHRGRRGDCTIGALLRRPLGGRAIARDRPAQRGQVHARGGAHQRPASGHRTPLRDDDRRHGLRRSR